ncbi:hypothetical protein KZZ52_19685 [Dactylosporangium sp. AC04546]|uniref:hypothetical protein n=1 Tax=Dactylosporangium sp. AC04546 TaxID=2862460 RepID=UPI001EDD5F92|nr:hypothetical protein [Dactylosporangium sp. AC04546]WVK87523.1 hypothetical protein KZZ52_19685 [Dactylosporangium sp. AC04546]
MVIPKRARILLWFFGVVLLAVLVLGAFGAFDSPMEMFAALAALLAGLGTVGLALSYYFNWPPRD